MAPRLCAPERRRDPELSPFLTAISAASWRSRSAPAGAIHNHLTIDLNDFLSIFGRMAAAH
jgi:hypothetical protein